jgi:two-component system, NarL family, nitrate/nitrite response regulator NarL
MAPEPSRIASNVPASALVVSEVRFLRESLANILTHAAGIYVCRESGTLAQALAIAQAQRPEIVLLDVAFPGGVQAAKSLSAALPEVSIVALAIAETEENVLAWAEAGIAGFVPNTASVDDLVLLIGQIRRGEQTCPAHIVGSLLRHIGAPERPAKPPPPTVAPLTRRELEISRLIATGLSNKAIARRLGISLGTTKSHVHNLLGKLNFQRRADVMVWMNAGSMSGPTFAFSRESILALSKDQ